MADKRTTNLFVGATMLLVPAIAFTLITVMKLWHGPDEDESTAVFAAATATALLLAGITWWIGGVLFRRALRSRATEKERGRPKIVT